MTSEGSGAPTAPRRSQAWRRGLLLTLVAVGIWGVLPAAPTDVELDYRFGTYGQAATRLEIELRDAQGAGIRRSEVLLQPGAREQIQHLRLVRGRYRTTLTFLRADGGTERAVRDVTVGESDLVEVDL